MSKHDLKFTLMIKALKIGEHFTVRTEYERQSASRAAKVLKRAGVINFDVVTRRDGKRFKIAAI